MFKRLNIKDMAKEEKIKFATSLLMDAGVDFKIGNTSFVHPEQGDVAPEEGARGFGNPALQQSAKQFGDALLDEQAKKIKEQDKEITRLVGVVEKKENSISGLYYEKKRLEKENADLKKGEIPARYFDKALVDKQAEKIKLLERQKLDLMETIVSRNNTIDDLSKKADKIYAYKRQFKHLAGVLHKKNVKIDELDKKASKYANKLADACTELRELKEKLANIVVNNVDAQALKSAENALKEKDEVIDDLAKEIKHLYDMVHGDPILKMKERKKEEEVDDEHDEDVPLEDNSEEIEMEEAVDRIRKALKEGKTVVVDHDDCADIINMNL